MRYNWLFGRGSEKLNEKRIIAVEDTTYVVTKTKPEENSGLLFFQAVFSHLHRLRLHLTVQIH